MRQAFDSHKRRQKNNAGFTTVEQIVVIVITLILASGLVFGVMKWVEWTQFNRQNEYARTIFVAAQNQLTEYSQSGQLASLEQQIEKAAATDDSIKNIDVTQLRGKDGQVYNLDEVWKQTGSRYQGEVYSITGNPGDYAEYLDGNGSDGTNILYDMLREYLYDTSILSEAVVCLEFTPSDGQVFAALYSDIDTGFRYEGEEGRKGEVVNISSREDSVRKRLMIGYYGVDNLSKATSTKVEKPSITEVRLNNEDTLNLTYRVKKAEIGELQYEIGIFDKSSQNELIRFTLDGNKMKNLTFRRTIPCTVTRYKYDKNGNSTSESLGEYAILAWAEEDTVELVLDAVDLDATSPLYMDAYKTLTTSNEDDSAFHQSTAIKELKNTMSFLRFGAGYGDIYCSIKASGEFYKTSAKKQSNSENACFGTVQTSTESSDTTNYTLSNTRHLYNVRYVADYTEKERTSMGYTRETDNMVYQIADDLDWQELIDNEGLFKSGADTSSEISVLPEEEGSFPSFKQLLEGDVLESAENSRVYTISGLKIQAEDNPTALYSNDDIKNQTRSAGLVLDNQGTIRNLTLDKIQVTGEKNVGGFCGVDNGTLENLVVKNTDSESVIQGQENIGGILGYRELSGGWWLSTKTVSYEKLTNYAKVTGTNEATANAGGIVGYLYAHSFCNITVEDCNNYGQVVASRDEMENIGGIVGYCEDSLGSWDGIVIQECNSSPQYTQDEIAEILSSKTALQDKLIGSNVGGIVGMSVGATIQNCDTRKESSSKEGYVFGGTNVGGIVGNIDKNIGQTGAATITGGTSTAKGVNAAHVLGREYVGGIIGDNAKVGSANAVVENWTNQGFVGATEQYAGGIAGYNDQDSKIIDCNSDIANNSTVRNLRQTNYFQADYVGGIAGYNNGTITSDAEVTVVANVSGNNFVGGIVGYNDVNATITEYVMGGGYVNGQGSYIGGYVGFNSSVNLLNSGSARYLEAHPNQVTGAYCVGGTIGGNVIKPGKSITTGFYSDNFLGELEATAYAGGFIGYNAFVTTDVAQTEIQASAVRLDATAGNLSALVHPDSLMPDLTACNNTNRQFTISGRDSGSTQSRLGSITADIYAGGVIGYSAPNNYLRIYNVVNKTAVTARSAVENASEQSRQNYAGGSFTYSYTGGIIGKVFPYTTLDNCSNQDSGIVVSRGTYTGGLCEINEGTIINCQVSSIGGAKVDYIGGIAGINKTGGSITSCTFAQRTITGRKIVGGITAENFGTISNCSVQAGIIRTSASGSGEVGGIVGHNYKGGTIQLSSNTNIFIYSNGTDVGGIVGVNEGTLNHASTTTKVTGSITGGLRVGGIAGDNRSGEINGFTNEASIIAEEGNAGGIAGRTNGNIANCTNTGHVTARRSGNAGGIVAENSYYIRGCTDTGNVSASNGISGGITAVNYKDGIIEDSTVGTEDGLSSLAFESKDKAGGVCAENAGIIKNTNVYGVSLRNLTSSKNSELGGITAENTGTITSCNVGSAGAKVSLLSRTAEVSMGGVAGVNKGSIIGDSKTRSKVYASLAFTSADQAYYGNLGGIAGSNEKSIAGYEFSGEVEGTGNNPNNAPQYNPNTDGETNGAVVYGYGGIAGVNGNTQKAAAQIHNCGVNGASITGLGDANNIANVGGIAGVNQLGASIDTVEIGNGTDAVYHPYYTGRIVTKSMKGNVYVGTAAYGETSAFGHTGGVAGMNAGSITGVGNMEADDSSVIVENYRGHVGGITGFNRTSGRITQVSTGSNWVVFAPANAQDNGCAGIIGYQAGENDLIECTNRALVEKTVASSNAVGGIIGRMEVATAKAFLIKDCKNYGDVHGNVRVGGVIGVWKYYGGTVSECKNYGNIISYGTGSDTFTAGIAACLYGIDSQIYGTVTVQRCENHGKIGNSTYGTAGIVGASTQKSVTISIIDCVNTGLITGSTNNAGIAAFVDKSRVSDSSRITNCRNYGYAYNGTNINGILPSNYAGALTIEDCFGIANLDGPISRSKTASVKNSYYLTEGELAEDATSKFYVKEISAPGILSAANRLYKLVIGSDLDTIKSDGTRAYFSSSYSGQPTYTFTFNTAIQLSSMELYWNRGSDARIQDYKVEYKEKEDADWTEYATVTNITDEKRNTVAADYKEEVGNGTRVEAVAVRITVTKSINKNVTTAASDKTKFNTNTCLIRAYFYGEVKGKAYKGYQGTSSGSTSNPTYTLDEGLTKLETSEATTFEYSSNAGEKGLGLQAKVINDSGVNKIVNSGGDILGVEGLPLNPLESFNADTKLKSDSGLKATGADKDNIRYEVFEKDDPYISTKATTMNATPPNVPSGLKLEAGTGGIYIASWDSSQGAQYYQYEVIYKDSEGNQLGSIKRDIVYQTSVDVPITDIDGQSVASVEMRVQAGLDTYNADGEVYTAWSQYCDWITHETLDMLPTPKIHLELVLNAQKTGLVYEIFLDNQDTYMTFLKKNGVADDQIEQALKNIKIVVKIANSNYEFTANETKDDKTYAGSDANINFIANATSANSAYAGSASTGRESNAPVSSSYIGATDAKKFADVVLSPNDSVSANNAGFRGNTADTLSYLVKFRYNESFKITSWMRAEVMATDVELGVPVVLSTSETRISDTTNSYIDTVLSGLPADLMNEERYKDITIRSYPSKMSNDIVYNGHVAMENVAAEELTNLYVTDEHQITDTDTGTKLISQETSKNTLADGFALELKSNGSYDIYYNSLLEYVALNPKDLTDAQKAKTSMNTQVFYYETESVRTTQKAPVIHVNDVDKKGEDGNPNEDEMLIYWDLNDSSYAADGTVNYKVGAVYDYIITGIAADGSVVSIDTGSYTTESGKDNQLTYDTTSWNYKQVSISISRQGEVNDQGVTTVFPNGSVKEIPLKLRMTQTPAPVTTLHKDEYGVVQKNTMVYDITWDNIPEEEREELSAYEITVQTLNENGEVDDTGKQKVEKYEATAEDKESDQVTKQIDLQEFPRGAQVEISVKSLATENASTYRDSLDGVTATLHLPSRLDVPDITTSPTAEPQYSETDAITSEALTGEGVKLTYKPGNVSTDVTGYYHIAVAVYDQIPEGQEQDSSQIKDGDAKDNDAGYWNSGAYKTLITKASETRMEGNLQEATYTLDELSTDYAGKWLKIVTRSVSDSNISSYWTDVDAAEDGTRNYRWIRIPRMQVDTPSITQSSNILYYDERGELTSNTDSKALPIRQTELSFDEVDQAHNYQIQVIHNSKKNEAIEGTSDYLGQVVDWIYLEGTDKQTYRVFYTSSEETFDVQGYKKLNPNAPVSQINEKAAYLGELQEDGRVYLPNTSNQVAENNLDNALKIATAYYVELKGTGADRNVTLQLSDAEEVNQSTATAELFTAQVSVQGKITEDRQNRYEDSKVRDWYRTDNGAKQIEMKDYPDALTGINYTLEKENQTEGIEGVAYRLQATANYRLVYEVQILNATGNVVKYGYISAYGVGTSSITNIGLLPISWIEGAARIRIRCAAIVRGSDGASPTGGLSQWSDEKTFPVEQIRAFSLQDQSKGTQSEPEKQQTQQEVTPTPNTTPTPETPNTSETPDGSGTSETPTNPDTSENSPNPEQSSNSGENGINQTE